MFDLSQLRCFVTVAEELHFGRAAARLNMTQPPLCRQIQVLEHIIDAPLLERTSRSVRLTPAGRSFLPEARRILKLAESAAQVARRIALGKTGSLKIGFTAAAAYGFLPDLIAACRARLPEVDFSLKEMVSGDQLEALASGQIDAGLLRPPIARPEFATKRVARRAAARRDPAEASAGIAPKPSRSRISTASPSSCIRPTSRAISTICWWRCSRAPTSCRATSSISARSIPFSRWCARGSASAIVPAAAASLEDRGCQAAAAETAQRRRRSSCSWSGGATMKTRCCRR